MKFWQAVLVAIAAITLSFLATGAIIYGICWCFGFHFSWKLVLGIWLVVFLIQSIFNDYNIRKDY